MKFTLLVTLAFLPFLLVAQETLHEKIERLPSVAVNTERSEKDWLIDGSSFTSTVGKSSDGKDIILTNGLVSRVFRIQPNLATTNIINNSTGETFIRTASPEGTITIDGKDYSLGGLDGIEEYGYLLDGWLDRFTPLPDSFQVVDFKVTGLTKRMEWNRKRWALIKDWNPKGKELVFFLEESDLHRFAYLVCRIQCPGPEVYLARSAGLLVPDVLFPGSLPEEHFGQSCFQQMERYL